ncbi:MAG: FlgD immunoglobulin-like domain containing protein [Elusimicrobiales bacterium]|nr:FlgD immunoglobulin-like domain containing protein [Elusimicrobiales bacterium]
MKKSAALALLLACAPAAGAAPYGAGFYDTSEYLAGRVAVNIVFVESNGSIDARTETNGWTAGKKSEVIGEIQNAMNWWAARNSAAGMSFVYNNVTAYTGYEPITRSSEDEGLWIAQVMNSLGYSEPDYYDQVFHYNNDRRDAAGTDWSFTFFLVDSQMDADGEFSDGFFAYAYLGGPFSIMTYDNDGYGIGYMEAVAAHEMGHIFYALDEYAESGCTTTERSGYLNGLNSNCQNGGGSASCIMRGDIGPYYTPALCTHSQKMLGWSDLDANGKLDVLDLQPTTALAPYSPDPTTNTSPTYYGAAHSTAAYVNSNTYAFWGSPRTPNDISINRVTGAEYNVDGGAWQAATASDGTYDENAEGFTFTAAALGSGVHTIQARAKDLYSFSGYDATPASDSLTINTSNPTDIPYIQDGLGDDIDYSSSKSKVSANWGSSSHANGINHYEYGLGTTPGTANTVTWTAVGLSTWVVRNVTLVEGNTYYFSVVAYANITGEASGISTSDGFRVDTTSPTARVIITSPVPAPTGPFSAKLVVTEANQVYGTPQLSFRTSGGLTVPFAMTFLTGSTWTAVGNVESYHSTGTATFLFSGYDRAGNLGTVISPAASFAINYALAGGSSGTVANSDGAAVYLPSGSYAGTIFVSISTVGAGALAAADAASGDSKKIFSEDLTREFTARDAAGGAVTTFASPVTLTLSYPDDDNDGRVDTDLLKENTLWLYYLDAAAGLWTPIPGVTRNASANTLSAPVSHFSVYTIRSANSSAGGMGALRAYPNPCDFRTTPSLTIDGLPVDALDTRAYIYNAAGELVRTLSPGDGVDGLNVIKWDGVQKDRSAAASGLYLYLVKTSNYGKGTGKFFIVW